MKIKIICCESYRDLKSDVNFQMYGSPKTIQEILVNLIKIAKEKDTNVSIADYTSATSMIMGHIIHKKLVDYKDVECEVHTKDSIVVSRYGDDGRLRDFPYGYYLPNLDLLKSQFEEEL